MPIGAMSGREKGEERICVKAHAHKKKKNVKKLINWWVADWPLRTGRL